MSNPLSKPEPWSLVASGYQTDTMPAFGQFCKKAIELADVEPGSEALDVACGPGTLSLILQEKVARVHSIDFSPEMIHLFNATLVEKNIQNIKTKIMDGQKLDFENEQFDRTFSMFGLMFFPDREKGFSEMYRVLKPGGRAVVSSWAPVEESPLMKLLYGAMSAAFPEKAEAKSNLLSLENPNQFKKEMSAAGFHEVNITEFSGYWKITDPEEFLDSMIRGSVPIVMLKNQLDSTVWDEKYKIMLNYLKSNLTNLPQSLPSKSYIAVGTKY